MDTNPNRRGILSPLAFIRVDSRLRCDSTTPFCLSKNDGYSMSLDFLKSLLVDLLGSHLHHHAETSANNPKNEIRKMDPLSAVVARTIAPTVDNANTFTPHGMRISSPTLSMPTHVEMIFSLLVFEGTLGWSTISGVSERRRLLILSVGVIFQLYLF